MTFKEFNKIINEDLYYQVQKLYNLNDYVIKPIDRGYEICEWQNAVYCCEKEDENTKILRLSLNDRSYEELLAEAEYIKYLYENGGSVSNILFSVNGNLVEKITVNSLVGFVSLFEKAVGMQLHENNYRYREGAPISEYYFNIGKTIGKIHNLSKKYTPTYRRHEFLDTYNFEYINELIPDSFSPLKSKLNELLSELEKLGNKGSIYGMIHFDYNDSNYSINFETGQITVYDFDNSCFGWYLCDLAFNWIFMTGWAQNEKEPSKRNEIMKPLFKTITEGYKSETVLDDWYVEKLPFFINVIIMTLIVDSFEYIHNNNEEPEYDFELSYLIKCIEDDIPYLGFFHEIYSCENPFEYEDERFNLFVKSHTIG